MHPLLEKYFKKQKINIEEMSSEEQMTYDKWDKILVKEGVSIEKIESFLSEQIIILTDKLINPDISDKKDLYLKAKISNYKAILGLIKLPRVEKKQLEDYLKSLLK